MERDASGLAGPSGILDVTASIKDKTRDDPRQDAGQRLGSALRAEQ